MDFKKTNIKVVLLDPDRPHDIPLPPRGWLQWPRRVVFFPDQSIENQMAEISNSVYRVVATASLGHGVEISGTDPDDLHRRAVDAVRSIEAQCNHQE